VSINLSHICWTEQRLGLSCCLILQTCLSTLEKLVFPWPTWALTYEFHSCCWPPAPVSAAFTTFVLWQSLFVLNLKYCKGNHSSYSEQWNIFYDTQCSCKFVLTCCSQTGMTCLISLNYGREPRRHFHIYPTHRTVGTLKMTLPCWPVELREVNSHDKKWGRPW